MRSYYKGVARDQYGAIISGAVIDIYLANSVTPANVYTVSTGGTTVNSVTSDAEGIFYFYVDTSDYSNVQLFKLVISHLGNTSTYDNISVFYYDNYYIDALGEYGSGTAYTQATIESALTAIGTVNKVTLLLRPGNWVLTSDLTIPANITLKLPAGAIITIPTGKTLTINGPFEAGLYQVFDCVGTGSVSFKGKIVSVIPQWFGDTGNSSSYTDHLVINKAIAAAGTYGTIEYYGLYYCGDTITSGLSQKHTGRSAAVPWSAAGNSTLSFSGVTGACFQCTGETRMNNLNLSCSTAFVGIMVDGSVTSTFLIADNVNVAGATIGCAIQQSWLTSLSNCLIRFTTAGGFGLYIDYCYNLHLYNVTLQFHTIGLFARNKSHVSAVNCCIEEMYDSTDSRAIKIEYGESKGYNTTVNLYGCYIEPKNLVLGIEAQNSTICHIDGCHIYLGGYFYDATGCTDVILTSRNNRFTFPSDETERIVYNLPTSGHVNISGDIVPYAGINIHYLSDYTPTFGFNIILPYNYYYPTDPAQYIGYPLRLPDSISGKFKLSGSTPYTQVDFTKPTANSQIFITPNNKAAALLQTTTSCISLEVIYESLSISAAATPSHWTPGESISPDGYPGVTAEIYTRNSDTNYTIKNRVGDFPKGVDIIASGGSTGLCSTFEHPHIRGVVFQVRTADDSIASGNEEFNFLIIN